MTRLTARMTVDALRRRVSAAGGFAAVLAKGDDGAGAVLLLLTERGRTVKMLERSFDLETGTAGWRRCGPQDVESDAERTAYIERRRRADPDLWLVELDIPDAERFVAETDPIG